MSKTSPPGFLKVFQSLWKLPAVSVKITLKITWKQKIRDLKDKKLETFYLLAKDHHKASTVAH